MTEANVNALSDVEFRMLMSWVGKRMQRFQLPRNGKWIERLAGMEPNTSFLTDTSYSPNLDRAKQRARQQIGDLNATWTVRKTSKGYRVTRVR